MAQPHTEVLQCDREGECLAAPAELERHGAQEKAEALARAQGEPRMIAQARMRQARQRIR